MASKTKLNGLGSMHTAGIFSDMTVDGPEIGTLVVIVDRAKNLPNRKTIGKQDPYCAARLGKEAKKTDTDRRGGQTPRWDQELRFTVHDSPDYYQLKVSVFNDDKKTDLIGETWVNLQEVVISGGGQSDIWHTLSCKGKYAGEVRIEITYYDTRPKQEKSSDKVKQASVSGTEDGSIESLKGPRQAQQRSPVKRRPLPSDPVTGITPVAPSAAPENLPTPPRVYSQPPPLIPDHVRAPVRGYSAPSAIPEHVQTPPRGYQSPNYIPNQSPLQSFEYNTPPPQQFSQSQGYDGGADVKSYGASPRPISPMPSSHPDDRYDSYDPRDNYTQQDGKERYGDEEEHFDSHSQYDFQHSPYELPQPEDFGSPPSPGGPPPPPPVHRSRHGSTQASPAPLPTLQSQGSYGFPGTRQQHPYSTPPREVHRQSLSDQNQRDSYQPYSSPTREIQYPNSNNDYQQSPPRHHSYDSRDSRYEYNDPNSMQPTVEDAPPSPGGGSFATPSRNMMNSSRSPVYEDRRYEQVPSPAPLNIGRGNATPGYHSASVTPSHPYSQNPMEYTPSNSRSAHRDRANTDTSLSSRHSYNPLPQATQPVRRQSEDPSFSSSYGLPPVPPTLVAGMDPLIAQEISERIYDEKRASYSQNSGSARGRYRDSPQQQQQPSRPHPLSYHEAASTSFVPAPSSYDDRPSRFSVASTAVVKPRAISPDPRRPMRKSVSPSPGPSPGEEDGRRLSGVPFGPDSYNALNPAISSSVSTPSLSAKYDVKERDPDAKIITHDGREIDPSDHIPESNYAPLLESKGPKYASQLPDRNYRPPPSTAPQTNPATGRRPLRQAGRPQSMASSPIYVPNSPIDSSTPQSRNRLQKKSNRMSAQPAPQSSPLAPITSYQDNSYAQRSPRGNGPTYDSNENYAPRYGSSPGYRASGPPPLPAKVPMAIDNSPAPPGSGDPWALLEEMKNIDLGSGRARRRGY